MFEIFEELDKFNNITFYDDTHSYIMNDIKATSVTTLIHKYEQPFDEEYWSEKKAPSEGCTPEVLRARWKHKNITAQVKGTMVHSYIENLLSRKVFPYDETKLAPLIAIGETNDIIKPKFDKIKIQADEFIETLKGRLIPIKSEFVLGDPEFDVCGMVDQIFYNKKSGLLEIWDWKTNGKLDTTSRYRLSGIMKEIPNSKLDIYSLQLGIYKYLLEKNTNLKVGNCYLVWFNEENEKYKVIKCREYDREVKMILAEHKKFKKLDNKDV
jgi:hypothetical protein